MLEIYTLLHFYSQAIIICLDSIAFLIQGRIGQDLDYYLVILLQQISTLESIEIFQTLKNMINFKKLTKNKNEFL